ILEARDTIKAARVKDSPRYDQRDRVQRNLSYDEALSYSVDEIFDVIRRMIVLLFKRVKLGSRHEEKKYLYICDQFKFLRQDLTVQYLKTGVPVHVYEIHARIALEKGGLSENNQSQTQLDN
ncbi:MAG: hypothetical protein Q9181_008166, partial [Wetmoreana brouardii]